MSHNLTLTSDAVAESDSKVCDSVTDVKITLADLSAKGASSFAHKNYIEAVDYFARASELQAELNGEMSTENGEILFQYGRSLFKVGQSKSDILGAPTAVAQKAPGESKKKAKKSLTQSGGTTSMAEGHPVDNGGTSRGLQEAVTAAANKPLFSFTGDENFEDSDEEDEDEDENGGEEEEEEDDLEAAFTVLELSRVLFERKLQESEEVTQKDNDHAQTSTTTHLKERLSEVHNLLAEISLENERYPNAAADFKASLKYKQELYSFDSEVIAQAHYLLSLALEFVAKTTTKADSDETQAAPAKESAPEMDEAMREEAAEHTQLAIDSTSLKLRNVEGKTEGARSAEQIADVKEMIAELQQRLNDLRAPPIDVSAALSGSIGTAAGGIFEAASGESAADVQARVEEATKNANDLSGLVRRKKEKSAASGDFKAENGAANGKRKASDDDETEALGKKAKVAEA